MAKKSAKSGSAKRKARPAAGKKTPAKKKPAARKVAARKTPARKTTVKKPAVKKAAAKKTTARKAAAAKKTAKKTPVKKVAKKPAAKTKSPAKATARKAPARKKTARKTPARSPQGIEVTAEAPVRKGRAMGKREMQKFRKRLLDLRDRLVDGISFLAGENLNNSQREASGDLSNYGIHMADQGTDNFDREFALNLVSNEQDLIYEIDEALERIETGTYGICELTGQPIEKARLEVIPYARHSREAQEQLERTRKRYRPFGSAMTPRGGR